MNDSYLPVVVGAAVVGDRMLRLLFSDSTVGDVDFSSERWSGVLEPLPHEFRPRPPSGQILSERGMLDVDQQTAAQGKGWFLWDEQ